jgi:hypothetical protein
MEALMSAREWTIALPFTQPLSLNDRLSWQKRHRLTAPWKDAATNLARHHKIPRLDRFTVVLHWAPRLERIRDPENLTATLKVCVDGLVRAGVADGDDPRYYAPCAPIIHDATGEPSRLWLVVTDLSGTTEGASA